MDECKCTCEGTSECHCKCEGEGVVAMYVRSLVTSSCPALEEVVVEYSNSAYYCWEAVRTKTSEGDSTCSVTLRQS
jgi:hypothetical protein